MCRCLYLYIGSLRILTNMYNTALATKQVGRRVLFPPFLIEHIFITNKDDLCKENVRIKQVLKENGYHKSIISKI